MESEIPMIVKEEQDLYEKLRLADPTLAQQLSLLKKNASQQN